MGIITAVLVLLVSSILMSESVAVRPGYCQPPDNKSGYIRPRRQGTVPDPYLEGWFPTPTHDPSTSMPVLTDDIFPQPDDEVKYTAKKKRVSHFAKEDDARASTACEKNDNREKAKDVHPLPSEDERKAPKKRPTTGFSKKKPTIAPISRVPLTAKDLFGDSEEEEDEDSSVSSSKVEPLAITLQSMLINKVATGVSKQIIPNKSGTHYIEVRVYRCSDIETVSPINRWRHAVTSFKIKTDTDTQLWQHLSNVVIAARKEFRGIPSTFSSYFSMQV